MSKIAKIKEKLAAILLQFAVVKTDKGVLAWEGDEDLKAGDKVYFEPTEEGQERTAAEDGEYTTEDGKVIVVTNGEVASITDPVAEVDDEVENAEEKPAEEKCEDVETDKVAIDELRKEVDELYKLVDSILEKIGESRREADERFSKLEKMTATTTIADEFEKLNDVKKTGNAKLDKFLDRYGK